ncbi:hypothetical protein Bbelb_290290 [Branchiostoma belcheri]|nr:hypothetical protein Bbelb_290290 [Branchiostoma belcheri]
MATCPTCRVASDLQHNAQVNSPLDIQHNAQVNSPSDIQHNAQVNSSSDLQHNAQVNSSSDLQHNAQVNSPSDLQHNAQVNSSSDLQHNAQVNSSSDLQHNAQANSSSDLQHNAQANSSSDLQHNAQVNSSSDIQHNAQVNSSSDLQHNAQVNSSSDIQHNAQVNSSSDLPFNDLYDFSTSAFSEMMCDQRNIDTVHIYDHTAHHHDPSATQRHQRRSARSDPRYPTVAELKGVSLQLVRKYPGLKAEDADEKMHMKAFSPDQRAEEPQKKEISPSLEDAPSVEETVQTRRTSPRKRTKLKEIREASSQTLKLIENLANMQQLCYADAEELAERSHPYIVFWIVAISSTMAENEERQFSSLKRITKSAIYPKPETTTIVQQPPNKQNLSSCKDNPKGENKDLINLLKNIRAWLLYYSLPIMINILPTDYYDHYSLLVMTIHTLLQSSITPEGLDRADAQLLQFVGAFEAQLLQFVGAFEVLYAASRESTARAAASRATSSVREN